MRRLLLAGLLFEAAIGIGSASAKTNTTHFLIASKAKAIDSPILQRRGITAATKVSEAANRIFPDVKLQLLIEPETTPQKIRTGNAKENVTKKKFYDHLLDLTTSVQADDTVFIYTHTHGQRTRAAPSELKTCGGIVLSLPVNDPITRGVFPWEEYAKLVLKIPARNVIVLTMACFSGELIDTLNEQRMKDMWKDRKSQGRNFVVLTSQNSTKLSSPIGIGDQIINPFTYALITALKKDSYTSTSNQHIESNDRKNKQSHSDAKITIGEFIDHILITTKETPSNIRQYKNTAEPQVEGSYNRSDVLIN